uniref:MFS domain-containing protein n=1 Tax=Syphacia muris TaxID=451379 RepID=A0A158R4J6_9BILA
MGKIPSLRMFLIATVICLGGSFHFGFQLCVTNPTQQPLMLFMNHSHTSHYGWSLEETLAKNLWSVIIATFSIGAIFGSLFIGYIGSRFGRKRGLYISFGLTMFSCILFIISFHISSFELYIIGRILAGFALSLSLGLAAMFLNESSPKEYRGVISTMTCLVSSFGGVIAVTIGMNNILGTAELWWYIFVTESIIILIVLSILPFIPESPSYLLMVGKEIDARCAITFFQQCQPKEVDARINEIKENLKSSAKTMSIKEVIREKYSRKGAIVGILIATICSLFAIETLGRRFLVLLSNGTIIFLNIIIFILMLCFDKYRYSWIGYCLIVVIVISQFFFCIGLGPLCFFIASEMVCQGARGVCQAAATLFQMFSRAVVLAVFLPLTQAVGQPYSYLILSVFPMIFFFIFLIFNLPETKNKTYREAMAKLPPIKLFLTSLLTSFGASFHFGYQMLLTSPSQPSFIELFVSIGFIKSYFGPKKGLYVSVGCCIIGVVLSIASFHVGFENTFENKALSYELYIVSRIITGIAITLGVGLQAILLNEASANECRGAVSMVTGILVQFGTVVGAILALPNILGSSNLWWYLYLVEVIIFIIVLLLLALIPESPALLLTTMPLKYYLVQASLQSKHLTATLDSVRAVVLAVFQPLSQVVDTSFAYLVLFTPTMVLAFLYLYFNLPETKNMSEQQMGYFPPLKLLLLAIFISFGGPFHYGFQSILTNPSQKAFMNFINISHINHYKWEMSRSLAQSIWSITVALYSVGGIFGSLSITAVSTKFGRKHVFGLILQKKTSKKQLTLKDQYVKINLCRQQLSNVIWYHDPKRCRGFISMMTCQAATGGAVVAAIVAMPTILGTNKLWWYLYLSDILMLVPLVVLLPFIPESPGYLAMHDKDGEARKAILFFHNCDAVQVEKVLAEIKENIRIQATSMSFFDVFKDAHLRHGVAVGSVISAAMSLSGSSTVNAFSVAILINCGLRAQEAAYGSVGLMAIMFVGVYVFSTLATFAVDRYGRRPLVLISCFGLTTFNVVVFAFMYSFEVFKLPWIGYILIFLIAMTKFFFAIGIGPLCFFVASEMVDQAGRSVSQSCATASQMIAHTVKPIFRRTICIAVFLSLKEAFGQSWAFLILFVPTMLLSYLFLYFNMPETKNRNYKEASIVICMAGPFHHGFQAVVTSPAQKSFMAFLCSSYSRHYGWELSRTLAQTIWSLTVAALSIGAIFGALSVNVIASRLGRKRGMLMAVAIEILSGILSFGSYFLLIASSPKQCRGFISMMICQAATLGTVCAAVIAMTSVLGAVDKWWCIYLLETITFIPVLVLIAFIHETPSYLLAQGSENEALKSIQFYHRCKLDDAKVVANEIRENLKLLSKTMKVSAIFKDKHSRKGVLTGVVVACSMSFSGASGYLMAALIALTKFFTACGIAPLSFFIASEMVGQAVRGFSQMCSSTLLMIIRTITVAAFMPLSEAAGRSIAFLTLFVFPLLFGAVFIYFNMPETKNRNYSEIIESMRRLPSISKYLRWKTYHSSMPLARKNPVKHSGTFDSYH